MQIYANYWKNRNFTKKVLDSFLVLLSLGANSCWIWTLEHKKKCQLFYQWATATGQTGIIFYFSARFKDSNPQTWDDASIILPTSHWHWPNWHFKVTFYTLLPVVSGFKPSNLGWCVNYSTTYLLPLAKLAFFSNIIYFSAWDGRNQTLKLGIMSQLFYHWATATGQTGIFLATFSTSVPEVGGFKPSNLG